MTDITLLSEIAPIPDTLHGAVVVTPARTKADDIRDFNREATAEEQRQVAERAIAPASGYVAVTGAGGHIQ